MNRRHVFRRDVLGVTGILALPLLVGELFVHDIVSDAVYRTVNTVLYPVAYLDHELKRNIIHGGLDGIYRVLITDTVLDTIPMRFAWGVAIALVVTFAVALVSIHVGITLASAVTIVPEQPHLRAVIGLLATIGLVSLVGNVARWVTMDPLQGQTFWPQAVAGGVAFLLLGMVTLHQRTTVT